MHIDISSIAPKEIVKGFHGRFIHSQYMTTAFWEVDAGSIIPMHQHMHEQTCQVIEGKFELTVDKETRVLEAGSITIIAPNIVHGGVAITDCKLLDIFSPVREDYQ